jgi:DNA-binding MarR family transcriptional regulator
VTDAGLRRIDHFSVSAAVRTDAAQPPSDVWTAIATSDDFRDALVASVRDLLAGTDHHERIWTLVDAGVTAADGGLARLLCGLERPPDDPSGVHERALNTVAGIIGDGMTSLGHLGMDALANGPLAALDAADRVPTIVVRVGPEFRDRRRGQRDGVCRLLAHLAQACDVRVVATGLTARWLAENHRDELPAEFSERIIAHRQGGEDVADAVTAARDALDPNSRAVAILREIAAEPSDARDYGALAADAQVSRSRVSQVLTDLEKHSLVDRNGPRTDKRVHLTPAGAELVDRLDAEHGRQKALDAEFRNRSGDSDEGVCNAPTREGSRPADGGGGGRHRAPTPHTLRWLGRTESVAVAEAAPEHGIGLVDHPVERWDDRNAPVVDWDADREQVMVAEEYDNPMSSVVTLAYALTHRRLWGRMDLPDHLRRPDTDFADLFGDHADILRRSRCLGWLPDSASSVTEFLAELEDAREELLDLTRTLAAGDYEDRTRFRAETLRYGLGLCGVMAHVLDLVDIDLVRVLRIPRLDDPDSFDAADRRALCRRVAIQAAIESRYRQAAAFRALLEDRDDKRRDHVVPTVDADDPFGQLIGRFVLVGDGADNLENQLRRHIAQPGGRDIHDDAPEFAVRVPILTPDRSDWATAMRRVARDKRLRVPGEAVTVVRALTGSIYDAVRVVNQLGAAEHEREMRLDEVRVALSLYAREGRGGPDRLLPETTPAPSWIVAALLRTDRPVRQTDIAEKAGVADSTVSEHIGTLEALGLVTAVTGGYRFQLPFPSDESGADVLPAAVCDDHADATALLFEVLCEAWPASEVGRLGDPDDPVGGALYRPPDYGTLREAEPWLRPWVDVAVRLCEEGDGPATVATFGAEPEQTSLQAANPGGGPA